MKGNKTSPKRVKSASKRRATSSNKISESKTPIFKPSSVPTPNKQVRFDDKNLVNPQRVVYTDSQNRSEPSDSKFSSLPLTSTTFKPHTSPIELNSKAEDDKELNPLYSRSSHRRVRASRRSGASSFSRISLHSQRGFTSMKDKVKSSKNILTNYFTPNSLPTLASRIINDEVRNSHGDAIQEENEEESDSDYEDFNPNITKNENPIDGTSANKHANSKEYKKPFTPPATLVYKDFDEVCYVGEDGIWKDYGFDVDKQLPNWNCRSIDDLLQTPDLRTLAPVERRVEVEDLKFKIVHNSSFEFSLLRAVSFAVTGSESNFPVIRKQILKELLENWVHYLMEMSEECHYDVSILTSMTNPTDFLEKYKEYYKVSASEPPLFHLQAAASRIGFSFVFFDASNYNKNEVILHNSRNPVSLKSKDVFVYHFIRTGSEQSTWTYEFMIPLGRPSASTFLEDGSYSIRMFDTLLVDRQISKSVVNERRVSTDERIQLTRKPMTVFGVDHRMFAYKPTYASDLWSLLAELLTGKLASAPVILRECLKERYFQAQYYHFSKVRKRRQVKGSSRQEDLDKVFQRRTYVPRDHRGSFEDLEHAATAFNFSYVVIGMDSNGNFFSKENATSEDEDERQTKLAFFVAFTTIRKPFWHALEDVSLTRSSRSRVFAKTTFTDDTMHMRSLYCRTQPCLVIRQKPPLWSPRDALISVRSRIVNGRNAVSRGLGFIFNPVSSVIQRASVVSMSVLYRFTRRARELRRFWEKRNRVDPDGEFGDAVSLKEIYIRENP